jgi:hypothetical protein
MLSFALFLFYLATFVFPAPSSPFPVSFAEYTLVFGRRGQSVKTQEGLNIITMRSGVSPGMLQQRL